MLLWLGLLPLALWPELGWSTLFATLLMAFLLLGIEEIGVQIEEVSGVGDTHTLSHSHSLAHSQTHAHADSAQPFSMLPLEDMAAEICEDLGSLSMTRASIRTMVGLEVGLPQQLPAADQQRSA